jgi:hypothetical protein
LGRNGSAIYAEIGLEERVRYGGVKEFRIKPLILMCEIGMICLKGTLKFLKGSKMKRFFGTHSLEKMAK